MKRNPFVRKAMSAFLALAMLLSMIPTMAFATGDGTESTSGGTAYIGETPYATLADAVTDASAGDTIVLYESVNSVPSIDKAITIKGDTQDIAVNCVIAENFPNIDGTVTFENLTFNERISTENNSSDQSKMTLKFVDCIFNVKGEYAIQGGSTASTPGNDVLGGLWVEDCTFNATSTEYVGNYMIYAQCVNTLTVKDCTFNGNGLYKGAIHTGDSTEQATIATISGNTVSEVARGVQIGNRVTGSSVVVDDNTFTSVAATASESKSGAVYVHSNADANAAITVTDNEVTECDVALYNDDNDDIAAIVTDFTGNTADGNELVMDETGEVVEVEVASATIGSALINVENAEEVFISAEISGLDKAPAKDSVVIETYSGKTLVATTTLARTDYFAYATLGVKICLTGDSSSWDTAWETGMPRADLVPDKNVLYVDGVAVSEAAVPMISTDGEASVTWANVPGVNPAPAVEVDTFDELVAALANGGAIKLTADIKTTAAIVTSGITAEIDLNGKTLTIGAGDNKFNDASNITIKNGNVVITGVTVSGNAIICLDEYEKTLVTTLTLDNVNLTGNGYSSAYGIFYIGASSVLNVNGGTWNLTNDTYAAGGVFKADSEAATLKIDGLNLTAHNVRRVVTYANTTIANSTMTITGDADGVDVEMEHGFNRSPLTITNSTITMKDMVGRGITAEKGAVSISQNSTVTMENCQEATIDVRNGQTVTVDSTSTVTVDAEPTITSGTINGTVSVVDYVAKIGDVEYATFNEAITAANALTGDVTVEIYGKVEYTALTPNLTGAYDTISFVGKTDDAEISITRDGSNGYISGDGNDCKVNFTDLILSKPTGAFAYDAGFMNVAFSVYRVGEVNYTSCTFPNGACAAGPATTYTECTFNKSNEKYALWAYGADVTVDKCVFDDDRGIKMYDENKGANNTTALTVKNSDFSKLTGKPAIVLTYGESVTLAGNTYSSTGVFELDKDGAPNGTPVTADIKDIACMNDTYADCGVLVDGKIYTTVTDAAAVATSGSTVTLFYNATETVELAEGVTLDKNGYTADNVTVATPQPAGTLNKAYISAGYTDGIPAVFGEATGVVAKESFVVKLYSGETLVGTATLVDNDKVLLNGTNRSITWHAALTDDGDSWWSTTWENGGINVNAIPDTAKLYVDDVEVSTCAIELNKTDLSAPIFAAVTDESGNVQSFVAGTGYLNGTGANAPVYNDAFEAALNTGGNIVMLRDITLTEKITVNKDATLDLNGKTITTSGIAGSRVIVLNDQCMKFVINANGGAINSADAQALGIIDNESCADVTINGGTYDFDTDNGGLFKFRYNMGSFTLNNITVETNAQISGPNGGSLQVLDVNGGTFKAVNGYNVRNVFAFYIAGGANATFDGVTIKNEYIGAIEDAGGNVTVTDCNISVTGINSAPYLSSAVAVSGGGEMTIDGGTYATMPKAASDANGQGTSHGGWTAIIMSSGGTMTVNGGTFSNGNYGDTAASNPRGVFSIGADADYGDNVATTLKINGGKFNSIGAFVDCETIWGSETDSANTYMPTMDITITGGDFTGVARKTIGGCDPISTSNPVGVEITGGTFAEDPTAYTGYVPEGYAALKNLSGNYVVGEKPTASVNNLGAQTVEAGDYTVFPSGDTTADMPLSFVMQFLAEQDAEDMATSPYAEWYGDFVITFTGIENGSFTANGCYLAGYYGSFGWVKVPVDGMTIENGVRYPVMLGVGMGQKYDYICESVKDFRCAMYIPEAILEANPNLKVNLELSIVDNSQGSDAATTALMNNVNCYTVNEHTYVAEDFVIAAPVTVTGTDGTTTNYATLAEAFANAKEGDVISLNEDITVTETINVTDNGVLSDITLDGKGHTITGDRIINFGDSSVSAWATGVKIKDLTIVKAEGGTDTSAIRLTGGTSSELTKVEVEGDYTYGINFYGTHGATLTNCNLVSAFTNANSDYKLNLVSSTIGTLYANNYDKTLYDFSGKVVLDGTSSITTLYADADTEMIDESSMARVTNVYDWGTEEPMVAAIGNTQYATLAGAFEAAKAGDTVTLLRDITESETVNVTLPLTINGNGKTLTYTGTKRAIDANTDANGANLTINNLTVDCTAGCQRGINYNMNGTLTLNGVTVKGTYVTYALNLPGSSDNATVNITNSDLSGCIALNIWGEDATINVTDSKLTSVDNSTTEGYAALKLNNDGATSAEGTTVTVTGGSITALDENKELSSAVTNATETGTITISDSTVVTGTINELVAVVRYEGQESSYGCYTLKDAITTATDNSKATVMLLKNIGLTESIKVTGAVTVDLNGKKLTGPDGGSANWYAFIVDGGDLTLKDSVGTGELWAKCYGVETKSGSFTMESGKITATNNSTYGSAIVNYGGNVTVKGGTISGNLASVYTGGYFSNAVTSITGGTLTGPVVVENWADKDFTQTVSSASNTYTTEAGYEWVQSGDVYVLSEVEEVELFDIYAANIKMGSDLTMYFYVEKADLVGTDYYAVVTKTYADGRADVVKTIQYTDWEEYSDTLIRFGFDDISAKEMADTITVAVYDAAGNQVNNEYTDSIRAYAKRILTGNNTDEAKVMMVDMLNYGAAAQKQFSYNTGDLANNTLTDDEKALATETVDLVNNQEKGIYQAGSTLTFAGKITLTMYFKGLTDGMYAVVEYNKHDHLGEDEKITYRIDELVSSYGYNGFEIDTLVAADYKQLVTCTVYNADGTVYDTAVDSMESYAARTGLDVSIFAMKYCAAAYNYLH